MTGSRVLISEQLHAFWLECARNGRPPSPVEVAQKQYGLKVPWHIRTTILKAAVGLGTWKGKRMKGLNLSRDHGKSYGIAILVLWAAEYVIPFLPNLRMENRRINIIGRDVEHLRKENMETIENLLCSHAPWLKLDDAEHRHLWDDPKALKQQQIKIRTWNQLTFELTNGVAVRGVAFAQNVRGGHVALTVLDDFIDDENAHHGAVHYQKILSAIIPSIIDGGLAVAVGTPIDDNDVWKFIEADPDWNFVRLPAMDVDDKLGYRTMNLEDIELGFLPKDCIARPEDLQCLWPFRMGYDSLVSVRGKTPQKELAFLREYMMQRAAAWNLLVHPDYFRQSKRHDIHYHFAADRENSTAVTFMGVDPSTLRRSNFAMWVGTKIPVHNEAGDIVASIIRPLYHEEIEVQENEDPEVRKGRLLQAMERLRTVFHRFNPRKVVIEGNGFQSFIEPHLEETDALMRGRIETISLTNNKHLDDGWPMIRSVFQLGHVEMPYGPTPQEKVLIEQGQLAPEQIEARRITDAFWTQLQAVKYQQAKILENEDVPRDSVAAFYFFLRAANYVPHSVGFAGAKIPDSEVRLAAEKKAERRDPELRLARGETSGPMGQLQKAQRYLRW